MMQNRALSVAPYVVVMPFTLGGAKLCQAAEPVGLPPYLADRGAGIPTPLLDMPRANRCLHGRSGSAPAPGARVHLSRSPALTLWRRAPR